MENLIVAGIGTDTGKTIVSAVICQAIGADYWKPVQAGSLADTDSHKVKKLVSNNAVKIHPEAYRLTKPMSPHAAAEIDGIEINESKLQMPVTRNPLVVELAGGLMVPLTKNFLNIDWVQRTQLPVVLVADYYLGSINHTLLSAELLKSRNVQVKGLIFNGEKNQSTFDVIMHRTKIPCLLEISPEKEINAEIIRKYADKISL